MRHGLATCVVLAMACAVLPACKLIEEPEDHGPASPPARLADESLSLEIFFVRVPPTDTNVLAELWAEVDEQQLSSGMRRPLEQNGFRAGFVSGQLPAVLTKLLEQSPPTAPGEKHLLAEDPRAAVTRRVVQTRSGRNNEIVVTSSPTRMSVLFAEDGQLRGRTYEDAQAQWGLKAFPQADGRVRLEIMPELHYGTARPKYIGEDGVFRLDASRPKQTFDKLALTAAIAPSEMLVVGASLDRPGSLGHHFFTEELDGRREQKLLLVRIARHRKDDLFSERPAAAEAKDP